MICLGSSWFCLVTTTTGSLASLKSEVVYIFSVNLPCLSWKRRRMYMLYLSLGIFKWKKKIKHGQHYSLQVRSLEFSGVCDVKWSYIAEQYWHRFIRCMLQTATQSCPPVLVLQKWSWSYGHCLFIIPLYSFLCALQLANRNGTMVAVCLRWCQYILSSVSC